MMEFLVEQWCHIPPIEFQTLVEYMPRRIAAVLWWPNALLRHYVGITFILAVTCMSVTFLQHSYNLSTTSGEEVPPAEPGGPYEGEGEDCGGEE
jgi:hypothetical protein